MDIEAQEIELTRLDTVIQRLDYVRIISRLRKIIFNLKITKDWDANLNFFKVPSHRSDCVFCNEIIRVNPTQEGPFDQNTELNFKVWKEIKNKEVWNKNKLNSKKFFSVGESLLLFVWFFFLFWFS